MWQVRLESEDFTYTLSLLASVTQAAPQTLCTLMYPNPSHRLTPTLLLLQDFPSQGVVLSSTWEIPGRLPGNYLPPSSLSVLYLENKPYLSYLLSIS